MLLSIGSHWLNKFSPSIIISYTLNYSHNLLEIIFQFLLKTCFYPFSSRLVVSFHPSYSIFTVNYRNKLLEITFQLSLTSCCYPFCLHSFIHFSLSIIFSVFSKLSQKYRLSILLNFFNNLQNQRIGTNLPINAYNPLLSVLFVSVYPLKSVFLI